MSFHCVNRVKDKLSKGFTRSKRRNSPNPSVRGVEVLESRELLATFAVTNLADSGAGSLRQAILNANAQPGADTIDFGVAGTIRVGRTSLPAITGAVNLDGS